MTDRVHRAVDLDVQHGVNRGREKPDGPAERETDQGDSQAETEPSVSEDMAVEPIGVQIARVARHELAVARRLAVEGDVGELDTPEPEDRGAVRIVRRVARRMVAPVDRGPVVGLDARGEPEPGAK